MSNTLNENKLTQLYKYLQLGGKHTTQELSEKMQLSMRTIQGYLKTLREEYGLKKEKKYYSFPDSYRHIDVDERVQMSTSLMISLYKNAIPILQDSVLQNFKQIKELSKLASQMHSPWFSDDKKSVKLQLRGDAILYMKREKSKSFTILQESKNKLLVEMNYYNDIEVLNFVKKWLPSIEIVDNDELKKQLYLTLKDYLLR